MKYFFVAVAMLVAVGCAGGKNVKQSLGDRDLLFPYGVYRQRVNLTLPPQAKEHGFQSQVIQFNGVVQLKKDAIHVAILSHFGTTVAKVDEDRKSGDIKAEIYAEAMKKHEAKVREYYGVLKQVLLAPATADKPGQNLKWLKVDSLGRPLTIETVGFAKNARFDIKSYDQHGIPEGITIDQAGFHVEIEVGGYDI